MDELQIFRNEVRAWLEANCPALMRTAPGEGDLIMSGSRVQFQNEDQRLCGSSACATRPGLRRTGLLLLAAADWTRRACAVLETEMSRLHCRPRRSTWASG